ncbi:hypothetical protein L1987_65394 [Smallanthus sonchifolius]|uniref:Uncharacterized protein n=1 Tax=Smallanthus sonchifolius TaxID=185202 RepID=A0ACB9BUK1_9ASTR|nr:hypothetical protein L1987_65394 [Smallanthus sonchifolius]
MSSANPENAPLPPTLPQEENQIPQPPAPLQPVVSDDKDVQGEPDQVQESKPEEDLEEQWEMRKEEDTSSEEDNSQDRTATLEAALSLSDTEPLPNRHCFSSQREIGESSHQVRPKEVGPTEHIIPPITEMSKPQPDPEAQ